MTKITEESVGMGLYIYSSEASEARKSFRDRRVEIIEEILDTLGQNLHHHRISAKFAHKISEPIIAEFLRLVCFDKKLKKHRLRKGVK